MKRILILLLLAIVATPLAAARRRTVSPTAGCPSLRPEYFFIWYEGRVTGCNPVNRAMCLAGETIDFGARTFGYPSGCDTHVVAWQFGDGTTANGSLQLPVAYTYPAAGSYVVTALIANRQNTVAVQQTLLAAFHQF